MVKKASPSVMPTAIHKNCTCFRRAISSVSSSTGFGRGLALFFAGFGVDSLVQVDATHFGAGMRGQRGDRVFH